jgi:crotonobetainyl-CoA:carnitine CoA-transferase CaiB-like acyl-CoA transferase
VAIVQSEFDKYTSQELVQKLRQADVVYELNQRWHELKNDPQATETGFMMEYKLPSGRTDWVIGNPAKFNGGRTLIRRKAPLLGEHTGEVLRKMGYPEESIADLTVRKIIK